MKALVLIAVVCSLVYFLTATAEGMLIALFILIARYLYVILFYDHQKRLRDEAYRIFSLQQVRDHVKSKRPELDETTAAKVAAKVASKDRLISSGYTRTLLDGMVNIIGNFLFAILAARDIYPLVMIAAVAFFLLQTVVQHYRRKRLTATAHTADGESIVVESVYSSEEEVYEYLKANNSSAKVLWYYFFIATQIVLAALAVINVSEGVTLL